MKQKNHSYFWSIEYREFFFFFFFGLLQFNEFEGVVSDGIRFFVFFVFLLSTIILGFVFLSFLLLCGS